jgi:hypothetical protein
VLLLVTCTYAAPGVSFTEPGILSKFVSSLEAATFTVPKSLASLMALVAHSPVLT